MITRLGLRNDGVIRMVADNREIWIGLFVIAALAVLVSFKNARSAIVSDTSGGAMVVTAKFNKVDGLSEGSQVRMGGIRIGEVSAMVLDAKFRAVVQLRIDVEIGLPKDTSAAIQTDGLFGSKFVVLEPGAEDEIMKKSDEIQYTQDALVVSDLLDLIISEGRSASGVAAKPSN